MLKFSRFVRSAIAMALAFSSFTFVAAAATPQTQAAYSGNWAGYVSTTGTFTGAGATWTVPTATADGNPSADATWVGIGGISTNDLIQVGTQAVFQSGSSQPAYSAWYEMLPASNQPISMTVNAGDSITASVAQESTGTWQVNLRDNTSGQNFQTTVSYSSSLSSAEWIEEMPSFDSGGLIPLDNFGTVQFSSAWATQNGLNVGIAQAGATELTMYNSAGAALATPSALGANGTGFTVTRTSATATGNGSSTGGFGGGAGYGRGHKIHRVGVGISGFGRGRFPKINSSTSALGSRLGQRQSTQSLLSLFSGARNGWSLSFARMRVR